MREVRKAFIGSPELPGELFQMELRFSDTSGIIAFTSDNADRLVGFHHERLMILMSEGQGLAAEVIEAAFACATSAESKQILYGNPTRPSGSFHSAATSKHWSTLTIPASEHPNVVRGIDEIPGGPSREWIASMAAQYGSTSSIYRSRVDAVWPDESVEGLVKRSWLDEAVAKWRSGDLDEMARQYCPPYSISPDLPVSDKDRARHGYSPLLSVDIARFGADSSVCGVVRGCKVESLESWHGLDTVESSERILELREKYWTHGRVAPPRLLIDADGIGGACVDVLKARGFYAVAYQGSHKSSDPKRWFNLRAESFWHFRELLEAGTVAIPPDEKLIEETLAVEWSIAPGGGIQIVGKDQIRKELGRSPDSLDAVVMGFKTTMRPTFTNHRRQSQTFTFTI